MRRRTGESGGFRGIIFLDSIDKLKRLHSDYSDAEANLLARLRTTNFGAAPQTGERQTECCGDPATCSTFRRGECWYFAANDPHQVVARSGANHERGAYTPPGPLDVAWSPVFSGTSGNIEQMISRSDLVFATSSLEVGFDDPDMTLVYQHYAPRNLASFVQRKGRGGRGADDRPITGVTLSIHSARDSWFFRRPSRMLDAAQFRVPINVRNIFVRRGQALSYLLDLAARWGAQNNTHKIDPYLPDAVWELADREVPRLFGQDVLDHFGGEGGRIRQLWGEATSGTYLSRDRPKEWRKTVPWLPNRLFDSINVPLLRVEPDAEPDSRHGDEDIGLAFFECAPGRMSRRWGLTRIHWLPYLGERAPLASADRMQIRSFRLDPEAGKQELLNGLPVEVRETMGPELHAQVARPVLLKPIVAGELRNHRRWDARWAWDAASRRLLPSEESLGPRLHHKTHGVPLGVVYVAVEAEAEPTDLVVPGIATVASEPIKVFTSRAGLRATGLRVTQAYWGSDVEFVFDTPTREREYARQIFTDPSTGQPRLYGFGLRPEGIRLQVDSGRLDTFLDRRITEFADDSRRRRWHGGQFLRYLVMTRGGRIGLNRFQARQFADLLITTAAVPEQVRELRRIARRWSAERLSELLAHVREEFLAWHPQISERRVGRILESAAGFPVADFLRDVMAHVGNPDAYRGYLRSVVLHGVCVRLRRDFVLAGLGDERGVIAHVRLPIEYGNAVGDDVITVCERGSGGDGTTRTFALRASDVLAEWASGGLAECPNARSDQAVERAFAAGPEALARWRDLDPRESATVRAMASDLDLDPEEDGSAFQGVVRLVFGDAEFPGRRVPLHEFYSEVLAVRHDLETRFDRWPTPWELVGSVVGHVEQNTGRTPNWRTMFESFGGLAEAEFDDNLSPSARLADQVYRLSARLCVDGCQACLHTGSDVMDGSMLGSTVSRRLLAEFALGAH